MINRPKIRRGKLYCRAGRNQSDKFGKLSVVNVFLAVRDWPQPTGRTNFT